MLKFCLVIRLWNVILLIREKVIKSIPHSRQNPLKTIPNRTPHPREGQIGECSVFSRLATRGGEYPKIPALSRATPLILGQTHKNYIPCLGQRGQRYPVQRHIPV